MDFNYLRKNIKEMLVPVLAVYGIVLVVLCVSCYMISTNTMINYPIEIWIHGCELMDFFLPLVSVLPFVYYFYMQRKGGFIKYASVRMNKTKYIFHQILSGVILSVACTAIAYYVALIFSMQLSIVAPGDSKGLLEYVFGSYQVYHPYLFGIVWCIWKGMVTGLFTLFGYFLAMFVDNIFIVALAPFLYCMLENLVTALLQIPEYSIMTCYVLNRLSPNCMSVWNYVIGVIVYVMIAGIIILILREKRAQRYEG